MANELKPWKYDIQHGPDGEANYAWVYDDRGDMIATMRTHKAKEIVDRMNTRPSAPIEGLIRYDISMFGNGIVEMGGGNYVRFDQAEAIIATKDAKIADLENELSSFRSSFKEQTSLKADKAALTARVKELEEDVKREAQSSTHNAQDCLDEQLRAQALETQLAAARKALEPFAEASKYYSNGINRRVADDAEPCGPALLVGHLHKARSALEAKP